MLPTSHSQAYQEFLVLLQKFRIYLDNLDTEVDLIIMNRQLSVLQEFFNQQILTLKDLPSQINSLATEIHREIKLLTTDSLFLFTSRQAATKQERLNSIKDRISKLITYSEAVLRLTE